MDKRPVNNLDTRLARSIYYKSNSNKRTFVQIQKVDEIGPLNSDTGILAHFLHSSKMFRDVLQFSIAMLLNKFPFKVVRGVINLSVKEGESSNSKNKQKKQETRSEEKRRKREEFQQPIVSKFLISVNDGKRK
ncbi:Hypothetical predicted protein [Mytilus galloprovincialis]|uniref:Uncharacterized protein n=1 Tax=Mytilus galloprovincialis TaxID=29158 RepID=A0A8B6FBB8_MYTGA|nr:Hypothetical predicted protein [Mytilus galloprovincialis]